MFKSLEMFSAIVLTAVFVSQFSHSTTSKMTKKVMNIQIIKENTIASKIKPKKVQTPCEGS